MSEESIYTGYVIALAFGGNGIIRHEGLVVFVPFTAIGDKITFQIVSRKKNYAQGRIVKILESSKERVIAPCPYFGTCGGCQLQHLRYESQLDAKRIWVEEALQRFGGWKDVIVPRVQPAQSVWHYRRRVSLHMKPVGKGFAVGYIATDNVTTLLVNECPIFVEPQNPIFAEINSLLTYLDHRGVEEGRVNILKMGHNKWILDFHFTTMPKNAEEIFGKRDSIPKSIMGIIASAPHKTLTYGTIDALLEVEGVSFFYSSKTFLQNHPDQSVQIYKRILNMLEGVKGCVLDLYCGIGISTLLIAQKEIKVVGVESNEEAIHLAKKSASTNRIPYAHFICADVANVLAGLLQKEKPQAVVLNPPREGLSKEVLKELLRAPVPKLIYISCMPSTLARDMKLLSEIYHPEIIQAYDMFPQTTHVESVISLSLKV